MRLTAIKGLQSEIYVPITPLPVFTILKKPLNQCTVALVSAAGIHLKSQTPYNTAGDFTFRKIPGNVPSTELMITHGGYDNSDANKDINSMFPIDRLREFAKEGLIGKIAPNMIGFMGGGGNVKRFKEETGPEIAQILKADGVDAVVLTAGCGTCHRSAVIVQREIEKVGISTIIIAALPPVAKQQGAPRIAAPLVPMGANAGEPHNKEMQSGILKGALEALNSIDSFGKIIHLPFEYKAKI
jgi:D-proline reductase (dithiol) PrdB